LPFFRDLVAAYLGQIGGTRIEQLIGLLKAAVEKDPSLAQL
jgi:hypothetical protein